MLAFLRRGTTCSPAGGRSESDNAGAMGLQESRDSMLRVSDGRTLVDDLDRKSGPESRMEVNQEMEDRP